jgi:Tfp pilus assembly protein PilE
VASSSRGVESAAGFGLVDMLCVVAVFALLATVSVPAFQNVTNGSIRAEAVREGERELRAARYTKD